MFRLHIWELERLRVREMNVGWGWETGTGKTGKGFVGQGIFRKHLDSGSGYFRIPDGISYKPKAKTTTALQARMSIPTACNPDFNSPASTCECLVTFTLGTSLVVGIDQRQPTSIQTLSHQP
jgi:hypothetical protein